MTDRVTIAGIAGITAIAVSLVLAVTFGPDRHQVDAPAPAPSVTVTPGPRHLPPCDSDVPGLPVTGTCWLWDDDGPQGQTRISVWPYPYAPTPDAVLEGSND